MPKVWAATIAEHRREVRDAVLDATAELVREQGLTAVTMSKVADATGIGRATLYKHFSSLEAVLGAWHEREVARHLHELSEAGSRPGSAWERLAAVLESYAASRHGRPGGDVAAALHRGEHLARAEQHLSSFVAALVAQAAAAGDVRDDIAAQELAVYSLHALGAAAALPSKAAVARVVALTLDGLRPPR